MPFFYISLTFFVNSKSDYRKNRGGGNLILFAKKLKGHTEKFTGIFFPKVTRFFVMPFCLKSGFIVKPLYIRIYHYAFMFVIAMCKLCKFFFEFLSFKITELLPFLGFFAFFCVATSHSEKYLNTIRHKVAFWSDECSNTNIFSIEGLIN